MADLDDSSFVAVNDIETAQGAPVSEALAQKYGSNENNLDTRVTSAESTISSHTSSIATNASNISSNTSAIAAIPTPEAISATGYNPTASFTTFDTLSGTPTAVIVNFYDSSDNSFTVVATSGVNGIGKFGTDALEVRISGSSVQAREVAGSFSSLTASGVGFV